MSEKQHPESSKHSDLDLNGPTMTDFRDSDSKLPVIAHANSLPSYHRGFFFWSLAPFLILFLVAMPVLIERRGPGSIIALCGVEAAVLSLLVGLWNPYRFWWTWRALGAIVFLTYLSYVIGMVIEGRLGPGRRSERTLTNALLGMFAFGLPGLSYAVFGRLTWRQETSTGSSDDDDSGTELDSDAVDPPAAPAPRAPDSN